MKAERVRRALYTLESKLEAVRLVQGSQSCAATAKVLGMPSRLRELGSASGKRPIGGCRSQVEQMELTRLRAELARVKLERDILKKATAYFVRESV